MILGEKGFVSLRSFWAGVSAGGPLVTSGSPSPVCGCKDGFGKALSCPENLSLLSIPDDLNSPRQSGGDISQVGGGHWGQPWAQTCSLCPQWTTDQQLIQTIRSVGVYDVVELKFAENRANGQSKG